MKQFVTVFGCTLAFTAICILVILMGSNSVHKNADGSIDVSGTHSTSIAHVYVMSEDGVIGEFTEAQLQAYKDVLKDGYHADVASDETVYTEYESERVMYKNKDYSKCIQPYYWGSATKSGTHYNEEYKQYLEDVKNAPTIWDFSVAPYRLVAFTKSMKPLEEFTFRFDSYINIFYRDHVVNDEELSRFITTIDLSGEGKELSAYNLTKDMLPEEETFDPSLSIIRTMEYEDYYDEDGNPRSEEEVEERRQKKLNSKPVQEEQVDGSESSN